jgi:hypothetical protein
MDLNKLRWLLIELSNEKHAEVKKLNRVDDLGVYLLNRARLQDQVRKLNEAIEALTSLEVGSDHFATIKKEG